MSDEPLTAEERRFFELVHPGGVRGLLLKRPHLREQDEEFKPGEFYAVVFFPKTTGIGSASADWPTMPHTLSKSPEAAVAKFMDGIAVGETWATYHDAGHRVRKVRVSDLGDAGPDDVQ